MNDRNHRNAAPPDQSNDKLREDLRRFLERRDFVELARFVLTNSRTLGISGRSAVAATAAEEWESTFDLRDDDQRSLLLAALAALDGRLDVAADILDAMQRFHPPVTFRDRQLPARYLIALLHDLGVPGSSRTLRWALHDAAERCRASGAPALSDLVAHGGDPWPEDGIAQRTWVFARAQELIEEGRIETAYRLQRDRWNLQTRERGLQSPGVETVYRLQRNLWERRGDHDPTFWPCWTVELARRGDVEGTLQALRLQESLWMWEETIHAVLVAFRQRSAAELRHFCARLAESFPAEAALNAPLTWAVARIIAAPGDGEIVSSVLRSLERDMPISGPQIKFIAGCLARSGADTATVGAVLAHVLPNHMALLAARFLRGWVETGEIPDAFDAVVLAGRRRWAGEWRPALVLPEPTIVAQACGALAARGRLGTARLVLRHVAARLRRGLDEAELKGFEHDRFAKRLLDALAAEGSSEVLLSWLHEHDVPADVRMITLLAFVRDRYFRHGRHTTPSWLPSRCTAFDDAALAPLRNEAVRLSSSSDLGEKGRIAFARLSLHFGEPGPALDLLREDARRKLEKPFAGMRLWVPEILADVFRIFWPLVARGLRRGQSPSDGSAGRGRRG